MMTDILELLSNMHITDDGGFSRSDIRQQAIGEIVRLRLSLESILLDVKFMIEKEMIPSHILDDFIYQRALELMSPEFLKEFNDES